MWLRDCVTSRCLSSPTLTSGHSSRAADRQKSWDLAVLFVPEAKAWLPVSSQRRCSALVHQDHFFTHFPHLCDVQTGHKAFILQILSNCQSRGQGRRGGELLLRRQRRNGETPDCSSAENPGGGEDALREGPKAELEPGWGLVEAVRGCRGCVGV